MIDNLAVAKVKLCPFKSPVRETALYVENHLIEGDIIFGQFESSRSLQVSDLKAQFFRRWMQYERLGNRDFLFAWLAIDNPFVRDVLQIEQIKMISTSFLLGCFDWSRKKSRFALCNVF